MLMNCINIISNVSLNHENSIDISFYKQASRALVNRVGKQVVGASESDRQLLLEAVLPYKETIVGLAHRSLSDSESHVTATASSITLVTAWWP